jgi:serine/threonine protein kinase
MYVLHVCAADHRCILLSTFGLICCCRALRAGAVVLQDLTGGNVLLTSFAGNPHGFSARVTDFGLARPQDVHVRSAPGRYGTVTHMAPETIRSGVLDYPCDAYGFGVLCWEMITGGRHGVLACLVYACGRDGILGGECTGLRWCVCVCVCILKLCICVVCCCGCACSQ